MPGKRAGPQQTYSGWWRLPGRLSSPAQAAHFDSVIVCFAKGLGAPVLVVSVLDIPVAVAIIGRAMRKLN